MKFMRPALVDIFFMTYFYRAGGGEGATWPSGAPDPLLELHCSSLLMTSLMPSSKSLQLFQYLTCVLYLYF